MIGNQQLQQTQTGNNMNGSPAGTQTNFNPNAGTITNLFSSVNQGGLLLNKAVSIDLGNNNTILNNGGSGNNGLTNNANQSVLLNGANPNAVSPNIRSGQFFPNSENNNFNQGGQGFNQGGQGFNQGGQGFNQGGQGFNQGGQGFNQGGLGFSQSGQGFNTGIRSNNFGFGGGGLNNNNNNLYNSVSPSGNMNGTVHCNICHNNISPNKNPGGFGMGMGNTMLGTQNLGANTFTSNFNNGLLDASVVNYQNLFQHNHQLVNE
jgi:hypothetical protein